MPLKLYKRGDIWHYRGTVAKRRLRGSTGTANKDRALQVIARLEDQQHKSSVFGPEAVLTFAQAALRYRAAGKPTRYLERIEDHWKDTLVREIKPGLIRQSAKVLYPKVSGATLNRSVIIPTQAIINFSADAGLCSRIQVERFETARKIKKPITPEWVAAFRKVAPPHLGALAMFMLATGARITEALRVEWSDLDLKAATVVIRDTKTRREDKRHLPRPLIVALANVPRIPGRTAFRYVDRNSANKEWRIAARRAGIEVLSFHCCRHGFATKLLREGVDPVTVAKLGGWATPEHVFKTYGHASEDRTLTDRIFDTPATHGKSGDSSKPRKQRAS